MSSPSNPQHEPTMEEILASIRKIISDDQDAADQQASTAAAAPAEDYRPAPPTVGEDVLAETRDEVLELTDEVLEDGPRADAAPLFDNDVAFEPLDDRLSEPTEDYPAMADNDLISESARNAMDRAFESLDTDRPAADWGAPKGTDVQSVFARAVQDAFTPALQQWIDDNSAEVVDQLRPLIREWMDENLPSLIETAVKKEISRISARNRRR